MSSPAAIRGCPFCAHDRCELVELDDQPGDAYAVCCGECGARGSVDPMLEAAVYNWSIDDLPPSYGSGVPSGASLSASSYPLCVTSNT